MREGEGDGREVGGGRKESKRKEEEKGEGSGVRKEARFWMHVKKGGMEREETEEGKII